MEIGELIYNLIVINMLMLIGSIPIVTTFTSFTSGYQVIKKIKRGESDSILKSFFYKYKANFLHGSLLNIIMILWVPAFYIIGSKVFATDILLLKVMMILLFVEVVMGILGSLILIEKRVHLIELIRLGLVDFHVKWQKYFTVMFISVVILISMVFTKFFLPLIFSGTIYLMDSLLELFSRKTEGDIPNNFLNVFEKTS